MAPDPITPDQRRSARVVLPSPTGPALHPVLTCGSNTCRHLVEPDPIGFAGAQLACPGTYLTEHAAACLEIGELSYLLLLVVQLAESADGTAAGPLRKQLRRIAGMARDKASVQRATRVVSGEADTPPAGQA